MQWILWRRKKCISSIIFLHTIEFHQMCKFSAKGNSGLCKSHQIHGKSSDYRHTSLFVVGNFIKCTYFIKEFPLSMTFINREPFLLKRISSIWNFIIILTLIKSISLSRSEFYLFEILSMRILTFRLLSRSEFRRLWQGELHDSHSKILARQILSSASRLFHTSSTGSFIKGICTLDSRYRPRTTMSAWTNSLLPIFNIRAGEHYASH